MNKIGTLILLISVSALYTDANKAKKEELDKQQKAVEENNEAEDHEAVGAEFPGFALRIPIPNIGALAHIRQQLENLFPGPKQADYKPGKTKTTTTSKNSTHGPFKTYSVTEETVSTDNKLTSCLVQGLQVHHDP